MSDISAAEKRRILREKRAAKMTAKGSDRLNKITGANGSFMPTESPLSSASTQSATSSEAPNTATTSASITASTATPPSPSKEGLRRFSHEFSDDPPTSDLKSFNNSPSEDNLGDTNMEKLLSSLLSKGHDHSSQDGETPDLGLPEDFMKLLSGGAGGSNMLSELFKNSENANTQIPPNKSLEEVEYDKQLLAYNTQQSKKLRLTVVALRFIGIFFLVFYLISGNSNTYPSFTNLRPRLSPRSFFSRFKFWDNGDVILRDASDSPFWMCFVLFEVISSALYLFASSKFPRPQRGGIVTFVGGFVPLHFKSYFDMILNYSDVYALSLNDFAFTIVLLGLLTTA